MIQANNPLHGKTLEAILNALVTHYGWQELADRIRINCFISDPSIKSSLKFLRKTPWARKKVEDLYIATPYLAIHLTQPFPMERAKKESGSG